MTMIEERFSQECSDAERRYSASRNLEQNRLSTPSATQIQVLESESRYETRLRTINPRDRAALERILGENNLFHANYFEQAVDTTRSVGKVHIVDDLGVPLGSGTGFLVGPGILLTNNHVLDDEAQSVGSFVEFDFELDLDFRPKGTTTFALRPDLLFITNAHLDFTFVGVESTNSGGAQLSDFGTIPLIPDSGKALINEPVSIVQHPNGGFKRVALRDSKILGIPDAPDDDFIHYSTDTDPGASGSPVLNDQWQAVALHHAGVPGPGGTWVANEGVRISRIFAWLKNQTNEGNRRANEVLESVATQHVGEAPDVRADLGETDGLAEARSFSSDRWDEDDGYDPDFLDTRIPLPLPADSSDVVQVGRDPELKYTHFSVAMSRRRRLPFVTAVNVDGSRLVSLRRGNDVWRLDPRIPGDLQIDNRAYIRNDYDRGHLVRRLSPVWGSRRAREKAEEDTFHYTNCAPQHKDLNRRTWLDLEDYILDVASEQNIRASIFTGPVFSPDDPMYRREFQIPVQYWKIACTESENGELVAAGYLQTQKNLIGDVREAFGDYKTYRVPIQLIQSLTELELDALIGVDSLSARESDVIIREVALDQDPTTLP